jgi:hypothetical protein
MNAMDRYGRGMFVGEETLSMDKSQSLKVRGFFNDGDDRWDNLRIGSTVLLSPIMHMDDDVKLLYFIVCTGYNTLVVT